METWNRKKDHRFDFSVRMELKQTALIGYGRLRRLIRPDDRFGVKSAGLTPRRPLPVYPE
jgi:hypothetical protein